MGHAVFVFGAAGAGKTTFCRNLREYGKPDKNIKLINLDPAQENGADYDLDLCEFLTVNEVMNECDFGPNGALFYALQEMVENIDELNLQDFEEEYFLFDCPGQIELFLHSDILQKCANHLKGIAKIAIVYLVDSTTFLNTSKLHYTMICATISMFRFYLPVINIISKADLLDEERLEEILSKDDIFDEEHPDTVNGRLMRAISGYVNSHGILDFYPLNWNDEDMVQNVFMALDNVLQRHEDVEHKEKYNAYIGDYNLF